MNLSLKDYRYAKPKELIAKIAFHFIMASLIRKKLGLTVQKGAAFVLA